MREIKFRAFEKLCGGWIYINFNQDDFYSFIQENGWKISDLEWQQFTGLKDKNRKNIYEGDIVKLKSGNYYDNNYLICFGKYYNGECDVDAISGYGWYGRRIMKSKRLAKEFDIHTLHEYLKYVEVIGNKYENLELLKE